MLRKKRTEITIETDQVKVIRLPRAFVYAWCQGCADRVRMVTPEQAAAIAGVSLRAICRLVEADALHFIETDDGVLYICPNSLSTHSE